MFDRAAAAFVAVAAASAAAALAVFAGGFALYALCAPTLGAAGAAGVVTLAAAVLLALIATFAALRGRRREREPEAEPVQAKLIEDLPPDFESLIQERPLATLAVTALAGVLAARHPQLMRDVMSVAARFVRR